jgi:hypothetical protein
MDLPEKKSHLDSGLNQRERAQSAASYIKMFVKTTNKILDRGCGATPLHKTFIRACGPDPKSNTQRHALITRPLAFTEKRATPSNNETPAVFSSQSWSFAPRCAQHARVLSRSVAFWKPPRDEMIALLRRRDRQRSAGHARPGSSVPERRPRASAAARGRSVAGGRGDRGFAPAARRTAVRRRREGFSGT